MTHLTADHRRTASPYDFGRLADAPPVPGDPQAIPSLTPRERQVLTLLGHAADNREISRRLGIAERTVKAHLTNLMTKIKVTSRTEAALYAYAHHGRIGRPA
ncbi:MULTISPECIES: helix-turn-helix domain-containing protein [Streptomyces]|uniref:helix-turn-helix domain-containing protein n=1 Tax=Streptomyces TaxID=1883 RepID=UPI0001D061FF|nr:MULTISPECIES: helix-turn-helix transcriptional regulator [Streptomyces]MYS44652.1 LuxR family transcriptional regulator [Streptomyces sp. SID5998]MYX41113.1 LuxR family transcriptional regulator [Streptomyces sp. SID89]NED73368.1 helix-turn-helix transcriptional regulator [Streptomyces sp. SID9944]EFF92818.1 LuxR family two component transcriptional regulator [Streptomyces sp. e14]MBY8867738.1 helix-turn-helix transcriptional regulator [Streptomyces sennicomposti]